MPSGGDAVQHVASVYDDLAKLQRHLELERCRIAAVLVFDDEDYVAASPAPEGVDSDTLGIPAAKAVVGDDVPGAVWRLVVGHTRYEPEAGVCMTLTSKK